jgi:hypothetical protein
MSPTNKCEVVAVKFNLKEYPPDLSLTQCNHKPALKSVLEREDRLFSQKRNRRYVAEITWNAKRSASSAYCIEKHDFYLSNL